jgi:hypothetical protein
MRHYITVQDMAAGFTVMLYDKQEKHTNDPLAVVNAGLTEYIGILSDFATKRGYTKPFNPNDNRMSIYGLGLEHALNAAKGADPVTAFIQDVASSVDELRRLDSGHEQRKPIIARTIADFGTLAGFVDQYGADIVPGLAKARSLEEKSAAVLDVYAAKHPLINTPAIYKHRLPRVLGI